MNLSTKADNIGAQADRSDALDHAVRAGLVSYGIVHLLIAWLAIQLAVGDNEGSASSKGALSELAEKPFGSVLLYVVAISFVALVVWQVLEATVGHRDDDGAKRVLKRVVSAGKAILYAALGYSALTIASGSNGGGGGTDSKTATLMSKPGGQVLVVLVGLGIMVVAGALVYRGLSEKFAKHLEAGGQTGRSGRAYILLGKVGYASKGVALAVVGSLFVWAGWSHDSDKSGGLDEALRTVLKQPFGSPLLILVAAGIGCFGLYCFAWARHLDR
ncbi:DUF1206 domain-containing protein [soil metagenome]